MNKKAFTFIELLITMSVLSIAILPLLNMFATGLAEVTAAGELSTARYLAQEGMEKIRNLNFTVAQLKERGDIFDPPLSSAPLELNGQRWRILNKVISSSSPLEMQVLVYREEDLKKRDVLAKPVVNVVTLLEDFDWGLTL